MFSTLIMCRMVYFLLCTFRLPTQTHRPIRVAASPIHFLLPTFQTVASSAKNTNARCPLNFATVKWRKVRKIKDAEVAWTQRCFTVIGTVRTHTHIRTKSDCFAARPGEEYFSTSARVLKPNLWMGSLESKGGKSVSTSPSSSAMWRQ